MNNSKRILLADDDEDLVAIIAHRCRLLGLEVERAYDGVTALEKIDRLEPDLVILDVNMPGGNGMNLCQMMSGDESLREIPVIIMTGRQDEDTIRGCHDLLAYYVLKSPEVWACLEPLLRELLGLSPESAPDAAPRVGDASVDAVLTALRYDTTCPGEVAEQLATRSARPSVLCIDDDREFATVMKRRLEERGVEVQQAFSGMEGYRSAFAQEVRAIILDYEMPDGNGEYVLRRLHENAVTRDIPVIALTGHRDKPLERRMTGLGVQRILAKPPDWDTLWSELQKHLEVAERGRVQLVEFQDARIHLLRR